MPGIAANHGHKGVCHKSHHKENLENGHIKLGNSEPLDSETIEKPADT